LASGYENSGTIKAKQNGRSLKSYVLDRTSCLTRLGGGSVHGFHYAFFLTMLVSNFPFPHLQRCCLCNSMLVVNFSESSPRSFSACSTSRLRENNRSKIAPIPLGVQWIRNMMRCAPNKYRRVASILARRKITTTTYSRVRKKAKNVTARSSTESISTRKGRYGGDTRSITNLEFGGDYPVVKGLVPGVECEPDSGGHTAYDAESKQPSQQKN